MTQQAHPPHDPKRAARRTVWVLAIVAFAIYGGFILTGVIGR